MGFRTSAIIFLFFLFLTCLFQIHCFTRFVVEYCCPTPTSLLLSSLDSSKSDKFPWKSATHILWRDFISSVSAFQLALRENKLHHVFLLLEISDFISL